MIVRDGWTDMMNDMTRTYIMMQKIEDFPVGLSIERNAPLINEYSVFERWGTSESVW